MASFGAVAGAGQWIKEAREKRICNDLSSLAPLILYAAPAAPPDKTQKPHPKYIGRGFSIFYREQEAYFIFCAISTIS
jgi:hypothetical protein